MITALGTFLGAGIVLVLASVVLVRAGDAIAERTGIGKVWIGAVLIAGATSLPEVATNVAAVRIGANDLAAGNLFGSSMANMLILAVIDLLPPSRRVLRGAALDNALAAGLAIVLNAVAALFVLTRPTHRILGMSPEAILLLVIFAAGMRAIYRHGAVTAGPVLPAEPPKEAGSPPGEHVLSLRGAIVRFALAAGAILASAPFFAHGAEQIAILSGLGSTFVGTILLGIATSLPELVACMAAVRMGSFDLAVGNLFGSNAFNMAIFFAMDLASPAGIFSALDSGHALSALAGIALMGLGLSAIVYRAKRRFSLLEPDSVTMLLVYAACVWLLWSRAASGR